MTWEKDVCSYADVAELDNGHLMVVHHIEVDKLVCHDDGSEVSSYLLMI